MAEEEVVAAAVTSPAPSDHKRKHEDLEPDAPEPPTADSHVNANENETESEEEKGKEAVSGGDLDESEAKRPRLEEKPDGGLVTENGFQKEVDEPVEENAEQPSAENNIESLYAQEPPDDAVNNEQPSDDQLKGDIEPPSVENPLLESHPQPSGEEFQEPSAEVSLQGDVSSEDQQPASSTQSASRKMEVPNNKVGVLIGKSGDTIRFLQINSGAKIQITRDADADPSATTRLVELIGTLENINKAEALIKDVIAEADAGGSPSLVARGFSTVQATGAAEQIFLQVPNEKVGLIIGKGGETIKNLQTRSGARIQLTPQHLPEGDQSKERTVRVSGDKKQIEMAREMIKEVMNQTVRSSTFSGGYNQQQQGFRPRGPAQPQWGHRGPHPAQPTGYNSYQQRGSYPSHNSQYPPQAYGNYPPQQMASRSSSYGSGWEQRPASTMQGPPHQGGGGGGYDYYGGGQGHMGDAPTSNPGTAHGHGPSPTPMGPPHSQGNYNYGQPAPYSQAAPPLQSYGHGYNEPKYENQGPSSHYPYGGSQPGGYPQGTHPGYAAPQDPYGKAPPYGPPSQHYGAPRASQPGDNMPYQAPVSATQPYGQNVPPQQAYPQTYPPYGSASATDGYNQLPPAAGSAQVYPQQGGPPVSGYGQQAVGYAQAGPTGGYGSYPTSQPGYTEQPAQNTAGYGGYQGAVDPAYGGGAAYGAPPATGQAGYAQPAPTQQYDQSVPPHSGGYGGGGPAAAAAAGGAPAVGYGKSASPQPGYPQYDANQMLGAHR